jgi:hypothetical protein
MIMIEKDDRRDERNRDFPELLHVCWPRHISAASYNDVGTFCRAARKDHHGRTELPGEQQHDRPHAE